LKNRRFNFFILVQILILSFSCTSFSEENENRYPFALIVNSENQDLKNKVSKIFERQLSNFKKLELKDANSEPMLVRMHVQVIDHYESKKNPETIAISVVFTQNSNIAKIVMEVFGNDSIASEELKGNTYELFSSLGGEMEFMNVGVVDDIDKVSVLADRFFTQLSERIAAYYDVY